MNPYDSPTETNTHCTTPQATISRTGTANIAAVLNFMAHMFAIGVPAAVQGFLPTGFYLLGSQSPTLVPQTLFQWSLTLSSCVVAIYACGVVHWETKAFKACTERREQALCLTMVPLVAYPVALAVIKGPPLFLQVGETVFVLYAVLMAACWAGLIFLRFRALSRRHTGR
jgi:hypothetical protein